MNILGKLTACWMVIGFAPCAFSSEPVPVPERFWAHGGAERPLWISASELVDEDGGIRWDILEEYPRNVLRRSLEDYRGEECLAVEPGFLCPGPGYPSDETIDDLARNSQSIVSGIVTGRDHGFYVGSPGTLLQIRVLETLKGGERYAEDRLLYVFTRKGDFELGHLSLCVQEPTLPAVPETGERILFYDYSSPLDDDGRFLAPLRSPIFVERGAGLVDAPSRWEASVEAHGITGFDELMAYSAERAGSGS